MRSSFIVHFIYRNYEFVVWGKIMKKVIFILIFISTITGCYSAKDDCYYGMTTICFGKPYSYVAEFQKPYSLGHTDSKQRWIDLSKCGVKYGDIYLDSAWDEAIIDPTSFKIDMKKRQNLLNKFYQCMENKGYIRIKHCGRNNSTSDKGLCNE